MKKQVWSSKWTFILASIGAAAGLGNLWRFPYLTYENGGAAFLVAYIICLFALAKPLIMTEIALAQKFKTDILGSFDTAAGGIGRFFAWVILLMVFVLGMYYAGIIAWAFDFLYASPNLAWGDDAAGYFFQDILNYEADPAGYGSMSLPILYGLIATYIAVYLSIFKGVLSVGNVVKWTVPLPFFFLVILFLNSTTLEGSFEGLKFFLIPKWEMLMEPKLWKDAITMSFFSTNVGLALTMVYAQHNKEKTDIVHSAWMIGIGDFLVSLTAGLSIFGTLGYMAASQGVAISEVVQSTISLVFIALPTGLAQLPWMPEIFAVLFFGSILLLAIDSMFALIEAVVSALRIQFAGLKKMKLERLVALVCVFSFLGSLLFIGQNGLTRFDTLDHFLFSHLFYFTITAYVIIVGWFLPIDTLRQYINSVSKMQLGSWFNGIVKFLAPIVFVGLYLSSLPAELEKNYEGYSDHTILFWGILPLVFIVLVALFLSSRPLVETKKK